MAVNIRKFVLQAHSLDELVALGTITAQAARFLLDAVMAGPHLVSALLKRWTAGTLHYRLSRQHLPYYLDEFTFRFNRRTSKARGMLFYRLLQQAVDTDPHPLQDLIGGNP